MNSTVVKHNIQTIIFPYKKSQLSQTNSKDIPIFPSRSVSANSGISGTFNLQQNTIHTLEKKKTLKKIMKRLRPHISNVTIPLSIKIILQFDIYAVVFTINEKLLHKTLWKTSSDFWQY